MTDFAVDSVSLFQQVITGDGVVGVVRHCRVLQFQSTPWIPLYYSSGTDKLKVSSPRWRNRILQQHGDHKETISGHRSELNYSCSVSEC